MVYGPVEFEQGWPVESSYYLSSLMHDPYFLSHIMNPDIPDAHYIYNASDLVQQPRNYPQHSRTQHSRTKGGQGSVGRKRKGLYRESYGRYTTLSRNTTIILPNVNHPYRHPRNSYYPPPASLNPVQLSNKPRTWRKGYRSPSKRGLGSYLGSLTSLLMQRPSLRSPDDLHPLLSYRSRNLTSIVFNLHNPPVPNSGLYMNLYNRPANALDFFQLATSSPVQRLLIWHPKLPWKIRIESDTPNGPGLTIQDVLNAIYEQLRRPIEHHEFYTTGLASADRDQISGAFHERCAGNPVEAAGGVRRVDFLGRNVCFVGLSRSRNGTWEMKTAVPERQRMTID